MSDDEKGSGGKKKECIVYADVHFEHAKTSRAKCVECCVTIEKGELKISKEVNSQNGKVVKSYHPNCALHVALSEDNRSKCQTCKEKLVMGQMKVKVGSSCKTGPGSKHHYSCIFEKGANAGFEMSMQEILLIMKKNMSGDSEKIALPTAKKIEIDVGRKTDSPKAKAKPRAKKAVVEVEEESDEDDDEGDSDEEEDSNGEDSKEENSEDDEEAKVSDDDEEFEDNKSSKKKRKIATIDEEDMIENNNRRGARRGAQAKGKGFYSED